MAVDVKKIWEEVKANHAALNACGGHVFEPSEFYDKESRRVPRTYKCTKCGGTVDSVRVHWYKLGLEHAGKQAQADALAPK